MGSCNFSHSTLNISFHLLLFSLFTFNITASSQHLLSNPIQDALCAVIDCGEGTCVPSNTSVLLIDCVCKPGWKKLDPLPSCLVPNCSLNFQCGNGAPPPPPPPPPPPLNLTPCSLAWCGDGNCVINGTGHYCQCNDGSANLLNLPGLACFKQCYLGADCGNVQLGNSQSPPTNSASPGNGRPNDAANCMRNLQAVTIIVLSAIFLSWI